MERRGCSGMRHSYPWMHHRLYPWNHDVTIKRRLPRVHYPRQNPIQCTIYSHANPTPYTSDGILQFTCNLLYLQNEWQLSICKGEFCPWRPFFTLHFNSMNHLELCTTLCIRMLLKIINLYNKVLISYWSYLINEKTRTVSIGTYIAFDAVLKQLFDHPFRPPLHRMK